HAISRDDDAAHGFIGTFDERGGPERVTDLHGCHLAHEDGHTVLRGNNNVLQIARALDESEPPYDGPRPARFDDVASDISVATHDRINHGRERNLVGAQAVRVDVDLVLPDEAADAGDFGHTRHGVELITDEPILDRSEFAQRLSLALDGVPEDVSDSGRV